jgi:hypothetical protein
VCQVRADDAGSLEGAKCFMKAYVEGLIVIRIYQPGNCRFMWTIIALSSIRPRRSPPRFLVPPALQLLRTERKRNTASFRLLPRPRYLPDANPGTLHVWSSMCDFHTFKTLEYPKVGKQTLRYGLPCWQRWVSMKSNQQCEEGGWAV